MKDDDRKKLEERLRSALEADADRVPVSPGGWELVQRRLRRQPWRVGALVAAGLALTVAGGLALPRALDVIGRQRVTVVPGSQPSPAPASPRGPVSPADLLFPGFWPVGDRAQAVAIQKRVDDGEDAWRVVPGETAVRFASEFVGWEIQIADSSVTGSAQEGWTATVTFRPLVGEAGNLQPGTLHTLEMVGLEGAQKPAWFVTALKSDDIVVVTPRPMDAVTSPITAGGRGTGFEGTIAVEIRDDRGRRLHPRPGRDQGFVQGGALGVDAFRGTLEYDVPSTPTGILIFMGTSGAEGPEPDWTIVRLILAPPPPAPPPTAVPPPVPTPTAVPPFAEDAALRCFFDGVLTRNLALATSCSTDRMAVTLESLLGPGGGSPVARFTIHRDLLRSADRLEVAVRRYESGPAGGVGGYGEDTVVAVGLGGTWLVDEWRRGDVQPAAGTARVRAFFVPQGVDPCGQAGPEASLVEVEREVLRADGPARQALEELFTGPLPDERATSALPFGSRVLSVVIDAGVARVDVSSATESGGGSCSMAVRVAQIERTLNQFPTVNEVSLSVQGRTQGIFQP